jgi:hypothetical protein
METLNVQPPSIDWLVYRDDTTELTVVLTDNEGNPIDLTDWDFISQVREYPTDALPIITLAIVKNENTLTLYLDNSSLPLISYFDIQGNNDETGAVSTVLRGQIIVEEDVTR